MNKLAPGVFVLMTLGCVNYTSVMQVAGDGSDTLTVELTFPYKENVEISLGEFEEGYQFPKGWETTERSVDTLDTVVIHRLQGRFASPDAVPDLVFDSEEPLITTIRKGGATRYHLKKDFETFDEEDREKAESLVELFSGKHDLDDYFWTEKLVVDGEIIEHNAASRKADTLIWKTSILDLITRGLSIEATWEPK